MLSNFMLLPGAIKSASFFAFLIALVKEPKLLFINGRLFDIFAITYIKKTIFTYIFKIAQLAVVFFRKFEFDGIDISICILGGAGVKNKVQKFDSKMSDTEKDTGAKKVKLSDGSAVAQPTHCQYFVKRKKRHCKMTVGWFLPRQK